MSATKLSLLAATFLLLVFLAQGIFFIRANSQTIDEATHLAAGYSYLATREFRLDSEHPSFIKQLQALPLFLVYRLPFNPDPKQWHNGDSYRIGQDFLHKSRIPADRILAWSRLPNLFLGALLVVLVGWWAYRLWGTPAAVLATALACFEPNLIAHSCLVTTDLGVALFIFLSFYLLWEYLNRPTWTRLAATGLSTGMALVSKFSSSLLIAALGVIIALPILVGMEPCVLPSKEKRIEVWQKIIQAGALFLIILFFRYW